MISYLPMEFLLNECTNISTLGEPIWSGAMKGTLLLQDRNEGKISQFQHQYEKPASPPSCSKVLSRRYR